MLLFALSKILLNCIPINMLVYEAVYYEVCVCDIKSLHINAQIGTVVIAPPAGEEVA